jgi:hypothetical protein
MCVLLQVLRWGLRNAGEGWGDRGSWSRCYFGAVAQRLLPELAVRLQHALASRVDVIGVIDLVLARRRVGVRAGAGDLVGRVGAFELERASKRADTYSSDFAGDVELRLQLLQDRHHHLAVLHRVELRFLAQEGARLLLEIHARLDLGANLRGQLLRVRASPSRGRPSPESAFA